MMNLQSGKKNDVETDTAMLMNKFAKPIMIPSKARRVSP